jgi:hypothetical protein
MEMGNFDPLVVEGLKNVDAMAATRALRGAGSLTRALSLADRSRIVR